MRRTGLLLLLLALCLWMAVPARAAESSPIPEAGPTLEAGPSPEPTPPAGPDSSGIAPAESPAAEKQGVRLYVDNKNVYAHMTRSYAQGYIPLVEGGEVYLVLPLLCEGDLAGDSLRARVGLGEPGGPFVTKNYERTVELSLNPVNGGREKVPGYWVCFPLELRGDRDNGSYPVTVSVSAREKNGGAVQEEFTVYVTITDGRDPNATPTPEPVPTPEPTPEPAPLGPKVILQSCQVESLTEGAQPETVNAGESLRATVTLKNTSTAEALENMLVTAASPGEGFTLLSPSDSLYLEALAPGGTVDMVLEYAVKPETPAGQYTIPLTYDFAYHKGLTGTGTVSARVNISQPLKMEFALLQMPAQAVISDTIQANVQAINLSHAKAYNVRASMEGDGLLPSGTAYIGDLEGGTSGEKPLPVSITSLTGSEMPYGQTTGLITYRYEDSTGTEYTETASFTLDISSPFTQSRGAEKEDEPGQWWIMMAVAALAALGFGGLCAVRAVRRRRG